jgi:alcohol dehydrogenase
LPPGTAGDVEDTLRFAVLSGVRARVQEQPLDQAGDAYATMEAGKARYRMVITTGRG